MAVSRLPFDVASLHRAYADGLTVEAVLDECFRRIDACGDPGIFISRVDADAVRSEAANLGPFDPAAKPLWGIPYVIKDNIDAAGMPTTAACPAYAYTAAEDAFVVQRLRDAGAVLIGKTNLDQFATGLVGVRTPYPPPLNSIDPAIVPGGSSSGSAVAVARGLVSFSLGTDTAGSGRVPAALNNIVGLKPTLGALSGSGVVPACRTLDTVSVFALTVDDAYNIFRFASVFDPSDGYARPVAASAMGPLPPAFRVAVPDRASRLFFGDDAQDASFARTLELIAALGGTVEEIDFTPFYDVAHMLYEGAWVAERYAVIEDLLTSSPDAVFPVTREIIGKGRELSAADAFRGMYRLQALKRQVAPILASTDLFCVPSIPTFYSVADLDADPIGPNSRLGTYTNFVNLLDMCGMAVPVAPRGDGRPGSVTILAAAGRDGEAAALAAALHLRAGVTLGATSWALPETDDPEAAITSDEIALAAVGAHMSGLPLNGELTKLGGRFIKAATTAPAYRLYALAGGPPPRPGLMRAEDGRAIDIEVWALPRTAVGAFLQGIPAPLGLGTVVLADGETVNGFICEAAGLDGARDITAFGGWRAYLAATE
jgi:allophanate hydrolase